MAERLPAFESFIRELREVWAAEPEDRARMERAKPLLERLVMDPAIKAHSASWPSTEGRKNLRLYVDPDYGFVINAVVRVPGRRGSVHDHADAWVLYGVLDGQESLERYDRIDDARTPGYAEVRLSSVTTGTQGKVDLVDWIESIPFEETRNYVQRVLENLAIYRHRAGLKSLAPQPGALWRPPEGDALNLAPEAPPEP